jgi:Zn-dependent peptidase ImmA (M78 family)
VSAMRQGIGNRTDIKASADPVVRAVADVYARAGLVPGGLGPIAPLRQLVASQGLVVEEVKALSQLEAARYLREHSGRSILDDTVDRAPLSGFLYANAAGGWILVQRDHPVTRRRFTIAHEVGHFVLHFLPSLASAPTGSELEFREELTGGTNQEPDRSEGALMFAADSTPRTVPMLDIIQMEEDADRFAAELLLPEPVVRELAALHSVRCGGQLVILERLLARACLVSRSAMRRRLGVLGLGCSRVTEGEA